MIKSLILSNSNNLLLLAYSISSANSLYKFKNLQKRALPSFNNDYSDLYEELFKKPGKTTANVSNYCTLFIEIFKNSQKYQSWFCKGNGQTENDEQFNMKEASTKPWNSKVESRNIWKKGLRYLRSKLSRSSPYHIELLSRFSPLTTN